MYLEHFQLRSFPFAEHAAATALWQDRRMKEGLARLECLLTMGELGLVTGPSGVGKSALIKRFLHTLTPQQCDVVYCHLAHLPSTGLLKLIAAQLGEPSRRAKDRVYEQILDRVGRSETTLLVILDEAHLLSSDALTDLRLLISSALDVGPPLKLLLVGQESLRGTIKRAQHADLLNRVSVRYQLRRAIAPFWVIWDNMATANRVAICERYQDARHGGLPCLIPSVPRFEAALLG